MGKWGPKFEGVPIATECIVISTGKEQTYTKSANAKCKGCGRESELERLAERMAGDPFGVAEDMLFLSDKVNRIAPLFADAEAEVDRLREALGVWESDPHAEIIRRHLERRHT